MPDNGLNIKAMLSGRPELLHEALDRSLGYLRGIADRPVAPAAEAIARLDELDETGGSG